MSSHDKGGQELATAWLRRRGIAEPRETAAGRPCRAVAGDMTRQPAAKPEHGAVFHSDMHRAFSRS